LETVKSAGDKLRVQVIGLVTIADDVTPELALSTIESITCLALSKPAKQSRRRSPIASGNHRALFQRG